MRVTGRSDRNTLNPHPPLARLTSLHYSLTPKLVMPESEERIFLAEGQRALVIKLHPFNSMVFSFQDVPLTNHLITYSGRFLELPILQILSYMETQKENEIFVKYLTKICFFFKKAQVAFFSILGRALSHILKLDRISKFPQV